MSCRVVPCRRLFLLRVDREYRDRDERDNKPVQTDESPKGTSQWTYR